MTGDTFNINAPGSVGKVQDNATGIVHHHGATDLEALLTTIVTLAEKMRGAVSVPDARILDDAVQVVQDRANREPNELGASLLTLLGIAGAAGTAGQAVIGAITQARALLGV